MIRKFISVMLAVLLSIFIVPNTVYAEDIPEENQAFGNAGPQASEESDAVGINVAYHSIDEIRAYVADNGPEYLGRTYETEPDTVNAPYAPGELSEAYLQDALKTVNTMRYIAGLDPVTLNSSYTEMIQAGVLVNAVNNQMSHYPSQPEGMDDDLYQLGAQGCGSSNLGMGYATLARAVINGWMEDGDSGNIDRIGHRRWVLNARMGQTGFGHVGRYTGMYAFDRSNSASAKTSNVWPAQNTPTDYFGSIFPWSVSTGSEDEDINSVRVTMRNVNTGDVYSFSNESADGYFNVETEYYGVPGAIIWRPSSITYEDGDTYHVEITGTTLGTISYTVHFFDLFEEETMTMSETDLRMYVGDTKTIYPVFEPRGVNDSLTSYRVSYSSPNPVNISMSNGGLTITAVNTGSAVITAYSANGLSAQTNITVSAAPAVPSQVTISPASAEMHVGDTKQLTASVLPSDADQSIAWSSSDPLVADVDSAGIVTAVSEGTATITAAAVNGVKAECIITVAHTHSYGEPVYTWAADYSTCTAEAECESCGEVLTETVRTSYEVIKAASCEAQGTGRYTAAFANQIFHTQTIDIPIEATGHKYVIDHWEWAEDFSEAKAVFICENDGSHTEEINADLSYETIEPTCKDEGKTIYTAIVTFEGKSYTDTKTITIPKTDDHIYSEPAYTWRTDFRSVTASVKCQVCGEELLSETVDTTYEVIREPTEKEEGTGRFTAVFENELFETQTRDIVIPAAGSGSDIIRIWFSDTEYDMIAGKTMALMAHTDPEESADPITFTSSDPSIVSNEGNLLKAHKAGSALITATASNGVSASCVIHVLFTDVANSSKFFYNPVYWAFNHDPQITTGTGDTTFSPNDQCTRGQIVTFLWRLKGMPSVEYQMSFKDVKEGKFFYNAVAWAASTGVTTGTSEDTFSPNDICTRGQIVTFLWRAMGSPEPKNTAKFDDVKEGKFYYEAVSWAFENGITTGTSDTTFSPNEYCTRGQAVTFLNRAAEWEESLKNR